MKDDSLMLEQDGKLVEPQLRFALLYNLKSFVTLKSSSREINLEGLSVVKIYCQSVPFFKTFSKMIRIECGDEKWEERYMMECISSIDPRFVAQVRHSRQAV